MDDTSFIISLLGTVGLLGAALFIGGLYVLYQRYSVYQNGIRTEGVVVENFQSVTSAEDSSDSSRTASSISYYPIVQFYTTNQHVIKFKGNTGSSVPEHQEGDKVPVFYKPSEPSCAQIGTFSQMWLLPVVMVVVGILLLLITAIVIFSSSSQSGSVDMRRAMLMGNGLTKSITIEGRISGIRTMQLRDKTMYLLVATGSRPGSYHREEFLSDPLATDPGSGVVGKMVTIRIDVDAPSLYYVDISNLLPDLIKRQNELLKR